jgi:hypothetical protein
MWLQDVYTTHLYIYIYIYIYIYDYKRDTTCHRNKIERIYIKLLKYKVRNEFNPLNHLFMFLSVKNSTCAATNRPQACPKNEEQKTNTSSF